VNSDRIELALRKQRLQLQSDILREQWRGHVAGLAPVFFTGDKIADGVRWVRRRPPVLIAGAVALVVARPRWIIRWGRRTVLAWRSWRRLRGWLDARPPID
jgi:hypothetical protein